MPSALTYNLTGHGSAGIALYASLLPLIYEGDTSWFASTSKSHSNESTRALGASKPRTIYVRDVRTANDLAQKLKGPLGFDTEHRPTFVKGQPPNKIALIQLGDAHTVLLIHVSAMRFQVPEKVKAVLEDPKILKLGVGIKGDARKLYTDFGISASAMIDLSSLARLIHPTLWSRLRPGNTQIGLSTLMEEYTGVQMSKSKKVTMSNWEKEVLVEKQIDYASSDCHAALQIYQTLLDLPPENPSGDLLANSASLYTFRVRLDDGFAITTDTGVPWKEYTGPKPLVKQASPEVQEIPPPSTPQESGMTTTSEPSSKRKRKPKLKSTEEPERADSEIQETAPPSAAHVFGEATSRRKEKRMLDVVENPERKKLKPDAQLL